jgi:hypothetical protein
MHLITIWHADLRIPLHRRRPLDALHASRFRWLLIRKIVFDPEHIVALVHQHEIRFSPGAESGTVDPRADLAFSIAEEPAEGLSG